jgi:hypothetical protein
MKILSLLPALQKRSIDFFPDLLGRSRAGRLRRETQTLGKSHPDPSPLAAAGAGAGGGGGAPTPKAEGKESALRQPLYARERRQLVVGAARRRGGPRRRTRRGSVPADTDVEKRRRRSRARAQEASRRGGALGLVWALPGLDLGHGRGPASFARSLRWLPCRHAWLAPGGVGGAGVKVEASVSARRGVGLSAAWARFGACGQPPLCASACLDLHDVGDRMAPLQVLQGVASFR